MARYIIQNKVYDTDKMTLVGTVLKQYEFRDWVLRGMYGVGAGRLYGCKLYCSDKGNWLLTHDGDTGNIGEAVEEKEAKYLLKHYDYDAYTKYFGELEEA